MFFQTVGFVVLLFVVTASSGLITLRFVKRHEVPRFTMYLGALVPGLVTLGACLVFELEMEWFFLATGAVNVLLGVASAGVLLYATRLTGLQPRVTPIDLSSKSSDFDSTF